MHKNLARLMSEQSFRLLRRLRGLYSRDRLTTVSAEWLAADLGMPLPSLRRCIYELRSIGFSVVHENGRVGLMYLGELKRRVA